MLPGREPLRHQKGRALAQGIVYRQFDIRFSCQAKGQTHRAVGRIRISRCQVTSPGPFLCLHRYDRGRRIPGREDKITTRRRSPADDDRRAIYIRDLHLPCVVRVEFHRYQFAALVAHGVHPRGIVPLGRASEINGYLALRANNYIGCAPLAADLAGQFCKRHIRRCNCGCAAAAQGLVPTHIVSCDPQTPSTRVILNPVLVLKGVVNT